VVVSRHAREEGQDDERVRRDPQSTPKWHALMLIGQSC
jgi:hypothetical protein